MRKKMQQVKAELLKKYIQILGISIHEKENKKRIKEMYYHLTKQEREIVNTTYNIDKW